MIVPIADSLAARIHYARRCSSRLARQIELAVCSRDPVHWCNHWCMTYDPRETPTTIPFDLFPKQEAFIRWLADRERQQQNGLVEKSREVGVSWLCCVYALHAWLFKAGCYVGFGSRKLEYVDSRGDLKSIFEKLRFLLYHLPAWMIPNGFYRKRDDTEARLLNPANKAAITGEGGDEIGRGGRASIYFVDEAAHLERPQMVDSALSATTRVRIDVSTPNGPGNPFATKRFSGKMAVFTLHWKDDPRKNRMEETADGRTVYPWYEAEKERLIDPVIIATQLDIDYSASIEGICIPGAWVRAAVNLTLPMTAGPIVAGLDVAEQGANVNALIARRGPNVLGIAAWSMANTTQTAHRAADQCEQMAASRLFYDCVGVGAGVRGTLASSGRILQFTPVAVNGGSSPTETVWPDGKTSKERFANLRAEMWWMLRVRFEKTFEYVTQGVAHPTDELISIPDNPTLIADLSQPRYFATESGKVQMEGKEAMRRRGVKSPDHGDALAYAFCPRGPDYGDPEAGGDRQTYAAAPVGRDAGVMPPHGAQGGRNGRGTPIW